jgi:hypothetical protein
MTSYQPPKNPDQLVPFNVDNYIYDTIAVSGSGLTEDQVNTLILNGSLFRNVNILFIGNGGPDIYMLDSFKYWQNYNFIQGFKTDSPQLFVVQIDNNWTRTKLVDSVVPAVQSEHLAGIQTRVYNIDNPSQPVRLWFPDFTTYGSLTIVLVNENGTTRNFTGGSGGYVDVIYLKFAEITFLGQGRYYVNVP